MSVEPGRHPSGLLLLVLLATCDWLAYWTVRGQLHPHLIGALADPAAAASIMQLFHLGGMVAFVLGGLAADLAGPRPMALAGGALLAAGIAALMIPSTLALHLGLGLVVAGRGLFAPGLAVLVADLYRRHDWRRDAGFTLFALAPQLGGFVAGVAVRPLAGPTGFAIGAAVAVLGVVALGRWRPPPRPDAEPGPRPVAAFAIIAVLAVLVIVVETAPALVPPAHFGGALRWSVLGWVVPMYVAIGAAMVAALLVAPLLAWLWLRLGERQPSSAAKLALGALVCALQLFVLSGLVSGRAGPDGPIADPALSIVAPTMAIAAGFLIGPIALSLLSRVAPRRFLGLGFGVWMAAFPLVELQITAAVQPSLRHTPALGVLLIAAILVTGAVCSLLLAQLTRARS
jgi:POT family proton-dependent oligopeptide transporter